MPGEDVETLVAYCHCSFLPVGFPIPLTAPSRRPTLRVVTMSLTTSCASCTIPFNHRHQHRNLQYKASPRNTAIHIHPIVQRHTNHYIHLLRSIFAHNHPHSANDYPVYTIASTNSPCLRKRSFDAGAICMNLDASCFAKTSPSYSIRLPAVTSKVCLSRAAVALIQILTVARRMHALLECMAPPAQPWVAIDQMPTMGMPQPHQ